MRVCVWLVVGGWLVEGGRSGKQAEEGCPRTPTHVGKRLCVACVGGVRVYRRSSRYPEKPSGWWRARAWRMKLPAWATAKGWWPKNSHSAANSLFSPLVSSPSAPPPPPSPSPPSPSLQPLSCSSSACDSAGSMPCRRSRGALVRATLSWVVTSTTPVSPGCEGNQAAASSISLGSTLSKTSTNPGRALRTSSTRRRCSPGSSSDASARVKVG